MRKRRSSAQGSAAQKRRKEKGGNFELLPPTSAWVMENGFNRGSSSSRQVMDENSNLQTIHTIDVKSQRDVSQASKADTAALKWITYSRRSKNARNKGKKKTENSSNKIFQENGRSNNNSSVVKSGETGFWRKKYNLAVIGRQDRSVREGRQAELSKFSSDNNSNKVEILGSETTKYVRRRGRRKNKNNPFIHANQISASEKELGGSTESENIGSVKHIDIQLGMPSKFEMKKKNNINQRMSVKEENKNVQRDSTIVAVNKSDRPHSPRCNIKIHVLKRTYSRRRKKSGQQGRGPHNSSYLSSQDNENDLYNKNLSMIDTAEADCKRMENDNASFSKNIVHDVEKDYGSRMKNMQTSTNIISSDSNFNFHEVHRMHLETKKPRKRSNKKNKTPICSNPLPINEKDMSGSIKPEIVDAVDKSELDREICSKSERGNVKPNFGRRHTKRRNRETKKTATVSKDDSLDSGQLCDVFPKPLDPKNEDLHQLKCETPIEEKSITKDGERCPYSSVQDVMSDTIIIVDNMAMPLQKPTISYGKKKLLILDLNGLLVDVLYEHHAFQRAPIRVAGKSVYKRPFCEDFLEFCFERFDVGVWSSRQRKNIDVVVNFLFGEKRSRLLFCWDLSKCTPTGFKTLENMHKPLVLKELKKLWNKEDEDLPWEKGDYSPLNTLLIDDSPYKALCNPPHTSIFPSPYDHRNENDYALGLEGDIRMYLEGLAMADNVQSYVKEHPFGQHAIMPGNPYWRFYLQIIEKMNTSFTSAGSC